MILRSTVEGIIFINFLVEIFFTCYFGIFSAANCHPVERQQDEQYYHKVPIFDNVQEYLTKFGYLPQSDFETGNLRTDQQLREAIKNFQNFGNLEATGELNEETRELLKKPRCGLPDILTNQYSSRRKRYTLQGQKWHHTNLTWSLRSRKVSGINHVEVRKELEKALQVWSRHSKLTFSEVDSNNADILIHFERGYHGDGFPFDGQGQILAHAFFPGPGRGGDVHFDGQEVWLTGGDEGATGTNLFSVAVHEFGHSLGLSHSSVEGAIMFPWYHGLKSTYQLPQDDQMAIEVLYGYKDEKPPPKKHHKHHHAKETATKVAKRNEITTSHYYEPEMTTSHTFVIPANNVPDLCDSSYDAVTVIRRETYVFKDRYIWRMGSKGLYSGYPAPLDRMWDTIPANVSRIDAAYERYDSKIVFFIGKLIYVFNGIALEPGYPRSLVTIGLPKTIDHIDAAMTWSHNGRTYLFSGTMYWRFDEDTERVELDYPRDMSMWKGVSYHIDSAFRSTDGHTYFFKGKGYWKFNDRKMRVYNDKPKPVASLWIGCDEKLFTNDIENALSKNSNSLKSSSSSIFKRNFHLNFLSNVLLLAYAYYVAIFF